MPIESEQGGLIEDIQNSQSQTCNHVGSEIDYIDTHPASIDEMYGAGDLAACPMFSGGYINFGYWKEIDYSKKLTSAERACSSKNLYYRVFESIELDQNSELLEVGSGQGNGCILALEKFNCKRIIGLDSNEAQIKRAKLQHAQFLQDHSALSFIAGTAENMPLANSGFSHLISIEAIQHFSSLPNFLYESCRVLRGNSPCVIAAFFPTSTASVNKLQQLIPNFQIHMHTYTLLQLKNFLSLAGFTDFKVESIGEFVWQGFDTWLSQGKFKQQ